jgi:hypothetical protein
VHNSGWVQSPGAVALQDPGAYPRLRAYVEGIVGAFGQDPRVLAWDVWNEPDNRNPGSYGRAEPAGKVELVEALLPQVYAWARGVGPTQPLTSGLWGGDWSSPDRMEGMWRVQIERSDVLSFHSYDPADEFERRVLQLERYGRPVLCTEYMARPKGSTFDTILPLAKKYGVGAINWGLVAGKTQTFLPWDSWQRPYVAKERPDLTEEPPVWFHEVFRTDGRPYLEREVRLIRELTGTPFPR